MSNIDHKISCYSTFKTFRINSPVDLAVAVVVLAVEVTVAVVVVLAVAEILAVVSFEPLRVTAASPNMGRPFFSVGSQGAGSVLSGAGAGAGGERKGLGGEEEAGGLEGKLGITLTW